MGPVPPVAGCWDAGSLVVIVASPWPESLVGETVGVSFPSLVSSGDAPYPAAEGGGSILKAGIEEVGPVPPVAGCWDAGSLVVIVASPWPESLVGEIVGVSFPALVSRGDVPYPAAEPGGDFNCQLDLLSPLLVCWQDVAKSNKQAIVL